MSRTPSDTRLVTVEQLAELLDVKPGALHAQRNRGQRPGSLGFRIGRRIFWDLDEVMADARRRRDEEQFDKATP